MDPLSEGVIQVGGQSYEVRVQATGHHFIAQVLDGQDAILELRVSRRAWQDGLLLSKFHGDLALIASELAQAVRRLLAEEAAVSDPEVQP